jgi:peptidoglycan/xylan/chitin deacetylase (PgdA/CDA1 family)
MEYIETYKEIKDRRPGGIRSVLKRNALSVFSAIDKLKGAEEALKRPRVHFLYFHHVFKDEEENLDLLLKKMTDYHTFISYSEGVERILNGTIDKPYLVLSSDDGFKNNLRAAEILNKYGAKACFFINPSIIKRNDFESSKRFCREVLNFPPVEFLNWDDVETLQEMGHEIGSHTMEHINIAETSNADVTDDMNHMRELLQRRCGEVKHFAFPYGRFSHFNEAGRKAVFDAGFISCASAERGCHINPAEPISHDELCLRRDHMVFDWKHSHMTYFIARSAAAADANDNRFPYPRS